MNLWALLPICVINGSHVACVYCTNLVFYEKEKMLCFHKIVINQTRQDSVTLGSWCLWCLWCCKIMEWFKKPKLEITTEVICPQNGDMLHLILIIDWLKVTISLHENSMKWIKPAASHIMFSNITHCFPSRAGGERVFNLTWHEFSWMYAACGLSLARCHWIHFILWLLPVYCFIIMYSHVFLFFLIFLAFGRFMR